MRVVVRDGDDGGLLGDGRAVDLRAEGVDAEAVRAAVRGESTALIVDCPSPSRWWERLGSPGDGTDPLDRVVAAARSRGHHPAVERELAAAERALRSLSIEAVDTDPTRRRLADAGTEVERLREEVATARGRLQSRREMGADTTEAEAALADATRRLSEAETELVAAEQAHDAAQRRAREAREARERRLRLQDRVANRRRDARRALATEVSEAFDDAVDAVPGEATLSTDPLGIVGCEVTAALAAARIADLDAPVVDTTDRFDSVAAAANSLGVPVVRV
ncbi:MULTISPECIES: DUF7856 family protein [Halolamina]|uniref:Uncharacterized protein n=1 Tax=Halolamina pelagica TaxID=699431 RepID=A0A1I5SBR9_9EURY|nr:MULTISPECIES: hypothetical protein [Halolamina]NHX37148.1 hypothetical protein [Halolamina sp. R1-12]SFP67766.1 hypothetical protein SAMN05216277_10627 [Halolamina pelagica]